MRGLLALQRPILDLIQTLNMGRAAIIGGGFGGLTAAAELARAGHRVVLFEGSNTLGGKAQVLRSAVTLDTGPTLLTMPDVVRSTFERIGAADLLPRFHRLPLQARYTWAHQPGRQFDCFEALEPTLASAEAFGEARSLERFSAEAKRIYRSAGEPYLEAPLEGLPSFLLRALRRGPRAFFSGMQLGTLDALARRHFRSPELRQFVNRFATYVGASPYEASAALAMIPHLERAEGVHHVEGGMGALVRALHRALERLGVEVHLGQKVQWQQQRGELVVAESVFDAVVVNADPFAEEPLGTRELALSGYVALLEVDRRLLLAHHHVVFGGDYPREFGELFSGQVPTDPTVYFCHPAATDETMAPPGKSGVFAMVNAPALRSDADAERWPEHAARLRERCLETLLALHPQLRREEVKVLGERTPVELAARGAPGGSIYGFLPHGRLGAFARPPMRSKTPGVFFAGGSTHPGGGVPMVMLSGRFAAQLAGEQLGLSRPSTSLRPSGTPVTPSGVEG